MKHILTFTFLLCSFSAFAQYPAQPTTKQELGRQTTGDGLIYRGSGAPAYTPANNRNAWIYYDTTNNRLYKSRLGSWSLMVQDTSAFNEIQMPYIVDDTLYLTGNVTGEPLTAYVNRVWPITNLSDTTSITGENQGDIAIVASGDTVAFRGTAYWNPFSGGGGGGTFNDFILAGDAGSSTITDGETATIAGGYGINTAESGGTVTVTADTSELVTPYDISGLPSGTGTNQRIVVWTGTNSQGNSTQLQSAAGITLDANLAYRITGGTTASRPTGAAGMMYWNTSNGWFDYHNGTSWFNPARSATTNGLFTAGSVLFGNSDGTIQQNNSNFFFDNSAIEFGIGTSTPSSKLDIQTLALGVTQTNTSGILLSTAGVAASGAQQISPALRWRGLGYGTTAGTSQSVDWRADVLPVQGTVPTSLLRFQSSVNGAAYSNSNSITFGSNGTMGVGTQTAYTSGFIRMATSTDATITSGWYNVDFVLGGYTHDLGVSNGGGYIDFRKISGGPVVSRIHSNGNSYLMGGNVGISTASPDRLLHSELSDAVTNAIVFPLRLTHITSGTAAAGSGAGLEFEAESAGGTNRVAGTIENPYTTATNAAEVSDLVFRAMNAGALGEKLRILGNGTLQIATYTGTANGIAGKTSAGILTTIPEGYGINLTAGGSLEADTTQMATQSDLAAVAASVAAIPTPVYGKFTGTTSLGGLISVTLSATPATGTCVCTNNDTTAWYIFTATHTSGTNVNVRVYDADGFGMLSSGSVSFSLICY